MVTINPEILRQLKPYLDKLAANMRGVSLSVDETLSNTDLLYRWEIDKDDRMTLFFSPFTLSATEMLMPITALAFYPASGKNAVIPFLDSIRIAETVPNGNSAIDRLLDWLQSDSPHHTDITIVDSCMKKLIGENTRKQLSNDYYMKPYMQIYQSFENIDAKIKRVDELSLGENVDLHIPYTAQRLLIARNRMNYWWKINQVFSDYQDISYRANQIFLRSYSLLHTNIDSKGAVFDSFGKFLSIEDRKELNINKNIKQQLIKYVEQNRILFKDNLTRVKVWIKKQLLPSDAVLNLINDVSVVYIVQIITNTLDVYFALPEELEHMGKYNNKLRFFELNEEYDRLVLRLDSRLLFHGGGEVRKEILLVIFKTVLLRIILREASKSHSVPSWAWQYTEFIADSYVGTPEFLNQMHLNYGTVYIR